MTGVRFDVEYNSQSVQKALNRFAHTMGNMEILFADIGEYLVRVHMQRFETQTAPDGTPWTPLSPRYQKRKKQNQNRILFLGGYLAKTLRPRPSKTELLFGTNLKYAATHQQGREIDVSARTRTLYFKRNKDGVGNKFVKKDKSDFAQDAKVGAYKIKIPARPFLGTSDADNQEILNIIIDHLQD